MTEDVFIAEKSFEFIQDGNNKCISDQQMSWDVQRTNFYSFKLADTKRLIALSSILTAVVK